MPSLEQRLKEFEGLDTQVLGISVDSIYSHENWAKAIGGITYPLLSDMHRTACKAYGIHNEEMNVARRATFIIDKAGRIRFKEIYGKGELPDPDKLLGVLKEIQKKG